MEWWCWLRDQGNPDLIQHLGVETLWAGHFFLAQPISQSCGDKIKGGIHICKLELLQVRQDINQVSKQRPLTPLEDAMLGRASLVYV